MKPYSSGDAVPAIMKRKWYIPAFIKTKYVSFMIYVQPKDEDSCCIKANFRIRFERDKKRIVTNIEELKEKILILEAGLNDYATELVKVALTQVVTAKWGVTPEKAFLLWY